MIININLINNNTLCYYNIKKDKLVGEYSIYIYRSFASIKQKYFPILKNFIIAKKEIEAEFFITELNKIFEFELIYTKSFGQISKQLIELMNSCIYITPNSRRPLVLSIPYLNGKSLSKIEKICLIDNNIYFVTKYKKEYIMHAINDKNIKCIVPVSSIITLYKKLKIAINTKNKIRNKSKLRGKFNSFFNNNQYAFHPEELITSTVVTELQVPRRNQREPRQPEIDNITMYENISPNFEPEVLQRVEPMQP